MKVYIKNPGSSGAVISVHENDFSHMLEDPNVQFYPLWQNSPEETIFVSQDVDEAAPEVNFHINNHPFFGRGVFFKVVNNRIATINNEDALDIDFFLGERLTGPRRKNPRRSRKLGLYNIIQPITN